jgi:hypothetical protein
VLVNDCFFKLWLAEISKIFFSETNELTEPKLQMNDHWNVLYQVSVFYADRKSKMATIAGHRLTLNPMGKMFQNASSLKPLGQLKPNWAILDFQSAKNTETW